MEIRKPARLRPGDVVGIVSPGAPVGDDQHEQFARGIATVESLGLRVQVGDHVFDRRGSAAGTRADRLADFHRLWLDPAVRMVLMSQGGTAVTHLLDGLDYPALRESPKILAGISGGTSLLNAVYARAGLVTYHGPDLVWTFGQEMSEQFRTHLEECFFRGTIGRLGPNPQWRHQVHPETPARGWRCLRGGRASGVLVGGHSRSLLMTAFAGYGPDFGGAILFLEGTDALDLLDQQFTALRQAGVFDRLAGLILGWFEGAAPTVEGGVDDVGGLILAATAGYSFPILEIGELGHNVENYVFPIGCRATIDAAELYLSIDETPVQ